MSAKTKTTARRKGITAAELREIALSLPGVTAGTSYGRPSFLLAGKFLTRRRDEDDSLVLIVGSIDERDMLLESDPGLFHITDHYRNYPAVLARMTRLDPALLRGMLERRWRAVAPSKRRQVGGADYPGCSLIHPPYLPDRGFAGQEMLDSFCLVNVNARMLDPTLGRMLSADTMVPDDFESQSYNRYSYVKNSPL